MTYDAWFIDVHWIVAGAAAAALAPDGAGRAIAERVLPDRLLAGRQAAQDTTEASAAATALRRSAAE